MEHNIAISPDLVTVISGINIVTLTGLASVLIFPQDTASSGLAPESEPSNSCPVFTYTA